MSNTMNVTSEEQLRAAGNEVFRQLQENPEIGISLSPDLADFIGAFEEQAFSEQDF